ncbi:MAG: TatD family hydrolase [Deltaproteobacteria bacterium]|nr:TatD family hydrolase [Deltaproteobacteria bacterium]
MLIDSHAHLELKDFDRDRDEVVRRARQNGVEYIITVGIDVDDSGKALTVADSYERVYAAVGVHPHSARDIDMRTYDTLRKMAKHAKVVAYGEIGLDFYRNLSPRDVQIRRFEEQMDLTHELGLPVIVHDREAHEEILAVLEKWKGRVHGIVHCFSGDFAMAKRCLDWGYYISIPGTVTFRNSEVLRDVVRKTPADRLLVETDCPFLTPEPRRGRRNEPANVVHTAKKVAAVKGLPFEELARITTHNAMEIFGLGERISA